MCDNKGTNNLNTGLSFIAGTLVGALVGAAAVVLLNPNTGAENRKKVAKSAREYSEKGEELLEDAVQKATSIKESSAPYVQDVVEKISPYVSAATNKIKGQSSMAEREDVDSNEERIQMLVDAPLEKPKKAGPQKSKKYFRKSS